MEQPGRRQVRDCLSDQRGGEIGERRLDHRQGGRILLFKALVDLGQDGEGPGQFLGRCAGDRDEPVTVQILAGIGKLRPGEDEALS